MPIKTDFPGILCPLFTEKVSNSEFIVFGKNKSEFRGGILKLLQTSPHLKVIIQKPIPHVPDIYGYGLRLRLHDSDEKSKIFAGLNIVLVKSSLRKSNGISIGVLVNKDKTQNGIAFGAFANAPNKINGLGISPVASAGKKMNGISIGGLLAGHDIGKGLILSGFMAFVEKMKGGIVAPMIMTEKITGIGVSLFVQSSQKSEGFFLSFGAFSKITGRNRSGFIVSVDNNSLKGVVLSQLYTEIDFVDGMTCSLINVSKNHKGVSIGVVNVTKKLKGIQFGFLNYAGNNPKFLKLLPIINLNFKKHKKKN